MPPELFNDNVRAPCPDCGGAMTTFEATTGGNKFLFIERPGRFPYSGKDYALASYRLLRCAGCGRGGLSTVLQHPHAAVLTDFYPYARETAPLPPAVPPGITAEYREAELCAAVGAHRAASALLRSVLEKTLKANGYSKGSLEGKIDEAAGNGIITAPRQRRAHDDIRVLGNDVLHDEWREVVAAEYAAAHLYAQRILEDFYDNRAEVEAVLTKAGRLKPPTP